MNPSIERKIESVNKHAGDEWNRTVLSLLPMVIKSFKGRPFLTEDIRRVMADETDVFDVACHDGRAWGYIMLQAKKFRMIEKVGYAPAKSSHYMPKTLWKEIENP